MRPFALGALECLVGVALESVRDLMTRVEGDVLAEKVLRGARPLVTGLVGVPVCQSRDGVAVPRPVLTLCCSAPGHSALP